MKIKCPYCRRTMQKEKEQKGQRHPVFDCSHCERRFIIEQLPFYPIKKGDRKNEVTDDSDLP